MKATPLQFTVLVRIGSNTCYGTLLERNARGNCLIRFHGSGRERWVKAACVSPCKTIHRRPEGLLAIALETLREAGRPLTAGEIIHLILTRNLWQPRIGKTPRLTLYAMLHTAARQPVPEVIHFPDGTWQIPYRRS